MTGQMRPQHNFRRDFR